MARNLYSPSETRLVIELSNKGWSPTKIAEKLPRRSVASVRCKIDEMGIRTKGPQREKKNYEADRYWTPQETKYLERNYKWKTVKQIAEDLDKSIASVTQKASRMRLKKT